MKDSEITKKKCKCSIILRWFAGPVFSNLKTKSILQSIRKINENITDLQTELCYHVELKQKSIRTEEEDIIKWVLSHPFHREDLTTETRLKGNPDHHIIIECGPLFNYSTSDSTNAVSICQSIKLHTVTRIECSKRYLISWENDFTMTKEIEENIVNSLHDKMIECRYTEENIPVKSFSENLKRTDDLYEINVMEEGKAALEQYQKERGLSFDERDLDYYTELFGEKMKRNPTNVECFAFGQSNSEHCRHWFFNGTLVIDDEVCEQSLMDMVYSTQEYSNRNSTGNFGDSSSIISGFTQYALKPKEPNKPCPIIKEKMTLHLLYTAETHNFATAIQPFSGGSTGTGSRIRNVEAAGKGGNSIAAVVGVCVGCLKIPGYDLPWENQTEYSDKFALPLDILLQANKGAADYANKFGEPIIYGFTRSFGLKIDIERREWVKPIFFTGGIGTVLEKMVKKCPPAKGQLIAKIGGPAYRTGIGGSAACSIVVQGDNDPSLDFNAVQRGDAELGQKVNRVVRTCYEMGDKNPILNIHDQGAGGNAKVLKEIVYPAGGIIYANRFDLGDPTLTTLEIYGAEYQESLAILCNEENKKVIQEICNRERVAVNFVGEITDSGRIVLALDESAQTLPVNLDLKDVLGEIPKKIFKTERKSFPLSMINLPENLTVLQAAERVLRHPTVCSKRFITNKVDKNGTGLIAQQPCCGPLHTPVADVAVVAISNFGYNGMAVGIGEQPIKGLVNSSAGGRMSVAEALTNLVFAPITDLKDIKCAANWMWAAKLPGEGAALFDTCSAMCKLMNELGIAVNGGKDSLSMAARVKDDIVKVPGNLVVSAYAPCPDVRKVITPDLKSSAENSKGILVLVDLSNGNNRLGGSILLQCYEQIGDTSPDIDNPSILEASFRTTQQLIKEDKILAGHDISDGGLITCVLEMAFAGMTGIQIELNHKTGSAIDILFAEEVGWVLEVSESDKEYVMNTFENSGVPTFIIGYTNDYGMQSPIIIRINDETYIENNLLTLMKIWEETNYRLEFLQCPDQCVQSEIDCLEKRIEPKYHLTFDPDFEFYTPENMFKVVVLREEGTNGDREMIAAFVRAGFEVWDITMEDLISGTIKSLSQFRGLIFPGGFSYGDILGTAKGWSAAILFHPKIQNEFKNFLARDDTFILGICNGCQLMGMLGWIGYHPVSSRNDVPDVILNQNFSERFENRFVTVHIENSRAMMFKGMEGSTLGAWIAHGEGRFLFKDEKILQQAEEDKLVVLRYCDDNANGTEVYPFNPSGSINGIAGMCTENGRLLAIMPHAERGDQFFTWPWIPRSWKHYKKSPWQRVFKNAYEWCANNN